jgi:hypothetical protein
MRSLAQKNSSRTPKRHSRPLVALAVACSLSLTGLFLAIEVAPAAGQAKATAIPVVKVTLGGSDDHTILVSKGLVGLGKTTFSIKNTGKKKHSFEICFNTTYSTTANSCVAGQTSKVLARGKTAAFTVTLQQGIHEYLSTVKGDAKAGMRGGLDAEPIVQPAPVDTTAAAPCAVPQNTAVAVDEVDYNLTLTPSTVPCGTVTFTVTNDSQVSEHNFSIALHGSVRAVGDEIEPGGNMAVLKVTIGPGVHAYQSDDPIDVYQGMTGKLVVTG